MHRFLIFFLFNLFALLEILAQAPDRFYNKFGGEGIDIGYGVKETYNRQYVIVGSTTSFGAGSSDAYLLLVDSMGHLLWQKTFGGASADAAKKVIVNPIDSGFIFTGFNSSSNSNGYDVYVVRTDKSGNLIWEKSFGGKDWDFGTDLTFSNDGNIVICGSSYSAGRGGNDAYLLKVRSSNGELLWEKHFGGANNDEFNAIFTKPGLELYVVGNTESFGDTNGDILFYKVNEDGDSLMRIIYGGPLHDCAHSVTLNDTNEIFIAGGSENYSNGFEDALFVKFDKYGNFVWRKNEGTSDGSEKAMKIIHSATRGFSENITIFTTEEFPATKKDIKTIYLESDGSFWGGFHSGAFGFLEDEEAFDISTTSDKGYIQVGYTKSFNDAYLEDIFLVKQDSLLDEGTNYNIVGIENLNSFKAENFQVFPNPITDNGQLAVVFYSSIGSINKITVYNVLGKECFSRENPNQHEGLFIDTKDWQSGVYVLQVEYENGLSQKKVIKDNSHH